VERGAIVAGFGVGMGAGDDEACAVEASGRTKWKDCDAVVPADGAVTGDSIYGILCGV